MSQNNIEYREIRKEDYDALAKIIRKTWEYDKFCSAKTAQRMSKIYLASCLNVQTYTCVAVDNGEPVGIIMGRDEKNPNRSFKHSFHLFRTIFPMMMSREGRKVAKMFGGIEKIDKLLLEETGVSFGGELAFFVLRDDQRGKGIGKELFNRVVNYMKARKITNFYLYTDCTCNFGFYEHQGMKRLGEKIFDLKPHTDKTMDFFIYGYAIPQD